MGHWSVSCGISNISITGGDSVILIPLEKGKKNFMEDIPWRLVTLPIFGQYDDYGGIENIKKDFNTKLIEREYKCTIEGFCYYLIGHSSLESEDLKDISKKQWDRISKLTYMWVRKDVWDFLTQFENNNMDLRAWTDFSNIHIQLMYLSKFFNISEYLPLTLLTYATKANLTMVETIKNRTFRKNQKVPNLLLDYAELCVTENCEMLDFLLSLVKLKINMRYFSKHFEPNANTITPQDGEDQLHLIIMENFIKILKNKIK